MGATSRQQDVLDHMARHHGGERPAALVELDRAGGVGIHVMPSAKGPAGQLLFTVGMSDEPQAVPPGADRYRLTELMIRLPDWWPLHRAALADPSTAWPVEWLRRLAAYPLQQGGSLTAGNPFAIFANGEPAEPFAPDTNLSCLLVLREPGEAGTVWCRDGQTVLLCSLYPLYAEERDLERAEGMPGLLERFQEHGLSPVVDPRRVSVAGAYRAG